MWKFSITSWSSQTFSGIILEVDYDTYITDEETKNQKSCNWPMKIPVARLSDTCPAGNPMPCPSPTSLRVEELGSRAWLFCFLEMSVNMLNKSVWYEFVLVYVYKRRLQRVFRGALSHFGLCLGRVSKGAHFVVRGVCVFVRVAKQSTDWVV